jgi:hypothetical protein
MTDPNATNAVPDNFGDLPIQPTGSGVADLEIAYERMKLAESAEEDGIDPAATPTEIGDDKAESAAHPS